MYGNPTTRMDARIRSMRTGKSYQSIRDNHLPEIKAIITHLRTAKCKELDIAHFLMGKKSLKDCLSALDNKLTNLVSVLAKMDIIKYDRRWFGSDDYYINGDAAKSLSYILNSGKWFGSWSEDESKTKAKLDYLLDNNNYSNTAKNTLGVATRLRRSDILNKTQLQTKLTDLKKIINALRKANCCTEFQIARFLMGEISLEDCGYSDSHMASRSRQSLENLTQLTPTTIKKTSSWLGDVHYIDNKLSKNLNYILGSGKVFGSWTEYNAKSADKLDALLLELIDTKNIDDSINEKIKFINQKMQPCQQVEADEINYIQKVIKKYIFLNEHTNFPVFLVKNIPNRLNYDPKYNSSHIKHSILLYKDGDKYKILIKPNFSNETTDHKHLRAGSYKKIKNAGIEITLDKEKNLESVDRVVTHSKHTHKVLKNAALKQSQGRNLKQDGFKEVAFADNLGKPRTIYVQKYLGESLHQTFHYLTRENKQEIMNQLSSKVSFGGAGTGTYDIKLGNVLWDGKIATFIDYTSVAFTYVTKSYKKTSRTYLTKHDDMATKCQYFCLCLLFFQLSLNDREHARKTNQYFSHKYEKRLSKTELTTSFKSLNPEILNNPFWPILMEAYTENYNSDELGETKFRNHMSEAVKNWATSVAI